MCVDTQKFRCCCGCLSLTQATIAIGLLYVLGVIANAINHFWIGMALDICFVLLFVMVIVKPYDISIRKTLYYIYAILSAIGLVGLVIFTIVIFASDWEVDWCTTPANYADYNDWFDNVGECVSFINNVMIGLVITMYLIAVPCALCILQILYYGWKEQETLTAERQAYNGEVQGNMVAQQHMVPAQQQPGAPTPGYYAPVNDGNNMA